MLRAYKCRLYPNAEQREYFAKNFGCCRWVYNEALAYCQARRKAGEKHPSAYDLHKRLPILKKQHNWLAEVDSQSLKSACADLDSAFKHFFRRCRNGETPGYPRFKSKRDRNRSFTSTQCLHAADDFRSIKIPKCTPVRCRGLREFEGRIKRITVSQAATGKYFASLLVDDGIQPITPAPIGEINDSIGIDLGCKTEGNFKSLATLSNGEVIMMPANTRIFERRLARANRKLARKTKGGKNWEKQRQRAALIHEKIKNRRLDFLHKTTASLVAQHQTIAIETLNISGMMAKTKPKTDDNGKHILNGRRAKSGLAKSVADAGMYEFTRQLQYKSGRHGVNLIQCGQWDASSKTCSCCGRKNSDLKLSDRSWECSDCGVTHDRDHNAAVNILRFAHERAVGPDRPELTPLEIE